MKAECDNLDAYLADELSPEGASQFMQHLDACDECRHAADEQRWIDRLLQSDVCASLEGVPNSLAESLRDAAAIHRRRKKQLIACGLAAVAAGLVVAVGWTLLLNRQTTNLAAGENAAVNAISAAETVIRPAIATDSMHPKAVFIGTGEAIAVPIESSDENVTVVQLYPTTDTERRRQIDLAFQVTPMEANGG